MNTLSESDAVKMQELEALNLPVAWLKICELTGPDLFLKIWHVASTAELQDRNALYVPSIKKYYQYQQAQFIKSLIKKGMTNEQIYLEVKKHGIDIHRTTIFRLRKKFNLPM